jgi:hypothetical protein
MTVLAAQGAHVLGLNTDGVVVKPAPALYPHQWSWDTAFIVIGLASIDLPAACANLDALFVGQWANGMVPHIVFDPDRVGYFPGPDRWACAELSPHAPSSPRTSGICQPPVHAISTWRVMEEAARQGPTARAEAQRWAAGFFPKLLEWHRFLARERTDEASGLLQIFHGWESGMDNSPRFDWPYGQVEVGPDLPPYRRSDLRHVSDTGQRPSDRDYDRYLWLVEEAKRARYDQAALRRTSSFRVGDVLFTAIFAAATDHVALLADSLGRTEGAEARALADAARAAVHRRVGSDSQLASDLDLRAGRTLATRTVAGFAPLIAGGGQPEVVATQVRLLMGPEWAGYPGLRWPLPTSTAPGDASFNSRSYWRGPVWPVMNWLLTWGLERAGFADEAGRLRQAALAQVADGHMAEYYEPFTGEPLGSTNQSWTAAVVVDWLCGS